MSALRTYHCAANAMQDLQRGVRAYLSSGRAGRVPGSIVDGLRLLEGTRIHLSIVDHGQGSASTVARAIAGAEDVKVYNVTSYNSGSNASTIASPAHAANVAKVAAKRTVRILVSFHYFKDADMEAMTRLFEDREVDWFADSGAFSAHTLGQTIDPEEYMQWVEKWSHVFTAVSAPDVIGDYVASRQATRVMLDRVQSLPVLPVYHVGEPPALLEEYLEWAPYIALGGMVPLTKQRDLLKRWLDATFGMIPYSTRVHGFGMTTWEIVKRYPWYSVDSSSWCSVFRFATLQLFDPRVGIVTVNLRSKSSVVENLALLRSYGLRVEELKGKQLGTDRLVAASVEAWWRAEEWLAAHEETRRAYLVCASDMDGSNAGPQKVSRSLKGSQP